MYVLFSLSLSVAKTERCPALSCASRLFAVFLGQFRSPLWCLYHQMLPHIHGKSQRAADSGERFRGDLTFPRRSSEYNRSPADGLILSKWRDSCGLTRCGSRLCWRRLLLWCVVRCVCVCGQYWVRFYPTGAAQRTARCRHWTPRREEVWF